jgi:hypothetical protein
MQPHYENEHLLIKDIMLNDRCHMKRPPARPTLKQANGCFKRRAQIERQCSV